MAKIPLKDMADKGYDNMPEWAGYILSEFKLLAKTLSKEEKLSANDLKTITSKLESLSVEETKLLLMGMSKALEEKVDKQELTTIWKSSEAVFASKREFQNQINLLSKNVEENKKEELEKVVNQLSTQVNSCMTQTTDITISSSELLNLNATPKILLNKPGAGKAIEVIRMELFLDFNATGYAVDAGEDLSLEYETSGQIMQVESTGFLDQTSDKRQCSRASSHPIGEDEDIVLKMLSGEISTGDSPLKCRIDYRVVDLLT